MNNRRLLVKNWLQNPETRVVATILLVLGLAEGSMRLLETRLSRDVAHLSSFASLADSVTHRDADERHVVFLGNSLTRYGVAADTFTSEVSRRETPVHAVKVTPDNTALADWFFAYRTWFASRGCKPDVLVIGFEGRHLADAPSSHPHRLARYYCTGDDLPLLRKRDLPTLEDQFQFLAAANSAVLSNRDRIERRVLDLIIPGYRDGIQELNSRLRDLRDQQAPPATYERLEQLIDLATSDGVRLVLVAMPMQRPYDIDDDLRQLTLDRGVTLIDCRNVPGITSEMFFDGVHMNETAAGHFTRALARAPEWSSLLKLPQSEHLASAQ